MNPYNEWESVKAFGAAADHKRVSISGAAASASFTVEGWYEISADVDMYWRGPEAAPITAVTTSTGLHQWAKDTEIIHVSAGDEISIITDGSTGTCYIDRIKGR